MLADAKITRKEHSAAKETSKVESVIKAQEEYIQLREAELVKLHEILNSLRTIPSRRPILPLTLNGDFTVKPYRARSAVGQAVYQYMQRRGTATQDEIREALTRGGIKWGKYPKRQVALAISNSPDLYIAKGDTVTLK